MSSAVECHWQAICQVCSKRGEGDGNSHEAALASVDFWGASHRAVCANAVVSYIITGLGQKHPHAFGTHSEGSQELSVADITEGLAWASNTGTRSDET